MFCHRFCFIRARSDIKEPADLKGCKVGLLTYQNSLALIVKGILLQTYGLPVTDVTWVTMREETVDIKLPPNVKIERADKGKRLEELLIAGEIDALAEQDLPHAWFERKDTLARLFPEFEKEERDYYKQTRIFPIMHPIVVKKAVLDRDPGIATRLYEAFVQSRRLHNEFMQQPHRAELRLAPPRGGAGIFRQGSLLSGTERKPP
jgi:4,5-dihydroxyphthalate decarboxylase